MLTKIIFIQWLSGAANFKVILHAVGFIFGFEPSSSLIKQRCRKIYN